MNVGDLIIKHGDLDRGKRAIILAISKPNLSGNVFVEVLVEDGVITKWYLKTIKVISEIQT
ncbi:MAG: hypothetical protein H8E12_11230 [Rhodobacteraceae bacterium]|nr:hypothetical protein [Paracoccaceae bacterium]